jgi:hypothetical protein
MQLEGVAAVTAVQSQGYLSRLWQMETVGKATVEWPEVLVDWPYLLHI